MNVRCPQDFRHVALSLPGGCIIRVARRLDNLRSSPYALIHYQLESLSVPKKTQPRANRARARSRRPVGVGAGAPATSPVDTDAPIETAAVPGRPAPTTASRTVPRRPITPRAPTTLTFNAGYMVRDFKILAVLAPSMVVLLVLAYFVLH
jgi:hypothetical protein